MVRASLISSKFQESECLMNTPFGIWAILDYFTGKPIHDSQFVILPTCCHSSASFLFNIFHDTPGFLVPVVMFQLHVVTGNGIVLETKEGHCLGNTWLKWWAGQGEASKELYGLLLNLLLIVCLVTVSPFKSLFLGMLTVELLLTV